MANGVILILENNLEHLIGEIKDNRLSQTFLEFAVLT